MRPGSMIVGLIAAGTIAAAGCQKSSVSGPHGIELSLHKPANQSMKQGDSNRISIAIDRRNFGDPVGIDFSNLPEGVRAAEDTIPAGEERKDFTLVASPTAAVVEDQVVTVIALGPDVQTHQTFKLTVKAR